MVDDMRVYIANLGKYNEGELVGDWFSFPIDEEDVAERIGLNSYYEEYAVHDTDNFPIEIGEYISIQELNEMYEMICELPDYITDALDEFVSTMEVWKRSTNTRTTFISTQTVRT